MLTQLIHAAFLAYALTRTVTPANYARIEPGMPRDEVERLLGAPKLVATELTFSKAPNRECYYHDEDILDGPRDLIEVAFDGAGRVRERRYFKAKPDTRTLSEWAADQEYYLYRWVLMTSTDEEFRSWCGTLLMKGRKRTW